MEENEGEVNKIQMEQSQMEIDPQKENVSEEEQVMKRLLQEWRHLDERFIPEDQAELYKEMFQQYKTKLGTIMISQPEHLGS